MAARTLEQTELAMQPNSMAADVPVQLEITPLTILQSAVDKGASIDTIERLVALQERMFEVQAKQKFSESMSRAQATMGRISADAVNPQTKSKYASYAALDKELRPIYSREGFALSFDTADCPIPEHVRVVCHVLHVSGHSKSYHIDMPADGKGAKGGDVMTKTHATGAAASYGMRYLLKMIFNVAVGEDDNDGAAPAGPQMPEEHVVELIDWIQQAPDRNALQKAFNQAYSEARKVGDKKAMADFIRLKDARKEGLE